MTNQGTKKAKTKKPVDAFPRCVGCGNPHLQHVEIDVYCSVCGWNSLAAFVDAGGLDGVEGYL